MVKILVTGSDSRFGKILKKIKTNQDFIFKGKKQLNILSPSSIKKNLKNINQSMFYILQDYLDL